MSARRGIIPVFIPHLGCPHDCVFCNQRRISGSLLPASPEDVTEALKTGLGKLSPGQSAELAFYGGSFTAIPVDERHALLDAAAPFLRDGSLASIRLSTRPDAIDPRVLDGLRTRGVRTVELGAQSMDDAVLCESGRGHRAEDTRRASTLIKAAGFELILQMMTGLPGSRSESDVNTAREIIALAPDGVRIYPTVVVRDTPLYDMWRQGVYREHTVEDATELCARIVPMFEAAGIPIIRLGLNPTDELSGGSAAAGAYHPALGELVRSRIMLHRARELLTGVEPGSEIVLRVPPARLSQMIGQHGQNRQRLIEEFQLKGLRIAADAGMSDGIEVVPYRE